jgi:hypothetical protein
VKFSPISPKKREEYKFEEGPTTSCSNYMRDKSMLYPCQSPIQSRDLHDVSHRETWADATRRAHRSSSGAHIFLHLPVDVHARSLQSHFSRCPFLFLLPPSVSRVRTRSRAREGSVIIHLLYSCDRRSRKSKRRNFCNSIIQS